MAKVKGNTVARVREIVEPFARQLGLSIWDVRFLKEGTSWYLRIFIDKDGGVSVDDCADLTRLINKPLDEADPIDQSYFLEVSSPGLERELVKEEHFISSVGKKVMVRTIRPVDGVRDFSGVLAGYDAGLVSVSLTDGSTFSIDKKETSFIKLDDFDDGDFDE